MSNISAANRAWKDEAEKRREKQEQSRNLPSRFQGRTPPFMKIVIDGGNTLDSGQVGVLWVADVDEVPSAYDPNVTSTFIDGVGRGQLYIDNELQDGFVLVVNDSGSSLGISLLEGHTIWCGGTRSIPVAGGGSVPAYLCG